MNMEVKTPAVDPNREYTPKEAAAALNLNVSFVLFLMRQRHLEFVEYGPRTKRIRGQVIIDYRDRNTKHVVGGEGDAA
ncbi:hypothetical protein [Ruegeria lacuscaerulensis]|uniref:hypothetical protein n=1 Tax=Ruegeria lacuscaerulensis TaxID=55218 RepID=UPI00147CC547|nr:hypothetical protein [Ruegeria lacuscaerulensis]